ncbi:MAG: hypothetical protein GOP50_03650 [Candidatus Heimdallarchaeota archaeon]|nr:hypothetical protein [Candidatus Heimdallarchaeota archaeon]
MKLKKLTLNLILITILALTILPINQVKGQESVYTSPTYRFEIDENSNFTVVSRAPLSWEENVGVNFSITFGAANIQSGYNISITYVDITYVYPDNETEARYLHAEDFVLNETIQAYNINTTLIAPADYNLFNISIEIIAKSSSHPLDSLFIAQFPGDKSYIQVERGDANPIINLPGFPDPQTFVRWIIIFVFIFLVMITPALFIGIPKTVELSKIAYKKTKEAIANAPQKREERRLKKLQKKAKKEEEN